MKPQVKPRFETTDNTPKSNCHNWSFCFERVFFNGQLIALAESCPICGMANGQVKNIHKDFYYKKDALEKTICGKKPTSNSSQSFGFYVSSNQNGDLVVYGDAEPKETEVVF